MHIVLHAMVISYLLLSLSLNAFVVPYDIWPPYLLRFYEISSEVFSNLTPPTLAYCDLCQCLICCFLLTQYFCLNFMIGNFNPPIISSFCIRLAASNVEFSSALQIESFHMIF